MKRSGKTKENAIPGSNRVQDMVAYLEAKTASLESGSRCRAVQEHMREPKVTNSHIAMVVPGATPSLVGQA